MKHFNPQTPKEETNTVSEKEWQLPEVEQY